MSSTEDMAASIVDASNFLRHAANPRTTSPWSIFVLAIISAILLRHAINTYRASGHDKKIGNQNHSLTTIPGPKRKSWFSLRTLVPAMATQINPTTR